jgi:tetratricopeptide (TPR) repeat protein
VEPSPEIQETARRLRAVKSDRERLQICRDAADELSFEKADEYELAATRLAVAREDTADFALRVLSPDLEPDRETRFLIFAIGAIACRRAEDKRRGDEVFELARNEFGDLPLFKHFLALSFDGGKKGELRRGLALERKVLTETAPHAGGAHLIARFILQLRECNDPDIGEVQLDEALDMVNEAIASRPGYAKFYATRAAICSHIGRFDDARNDLLEAIRLEDRGATDAHERIAEYKLERKILEMHRSLGSLADKVGVVESRTQRTLERLRDAEFSVITAVAFVAGILALVQITLTNVTGRSVGASIVIVGSFGAILFGAVAFGAWLLRRPWGKVAPGDSSDSAQATSNDTIGNVD